MKRLAAGCAAGRRGVHIRAGCRNCCNDCCGEPQARHSLHSSPSATRLLLCPGCGYHSTTQLRMRLAVLGEDEVVLSNCSCQRVCGLRSRVARRRTSLRQSYAATNSDCWCVRTRRPHTRPPAIGTVVFPGQSSCMYSRTAYGWPIVAGSLVWT